MYVGARIAIVVSEDKFPFFRNATLDKIRPRILASKVGNFDFRGTKPWKTLICIPRKRNIIKLVRKMFGPNYCLLYTSDAADE